MSGSITSKIERYLELLATDVFRVETRWPQFQLLLDDMRELSQSDGGEDVVVSIERNALYGGVSLFAPLFQHCQFSSVDFSPEVNLTRGAYKSHLLSRIRMEFGEQFLASPSLFQFSQAGLRPNLVVIPNLLHHIPKPWEFFDQHVSPLGAEIIYIFDSTLREWHQISDDYCRMTPFALEELMSGRGYELVSTKTTGGPFSAVLYCWEQALEYLKADESLYERYSAWINDTHKKELLELEDKFTINIERPTSRFPTAYSVRFRKVEAA